MKRLLLCAALLLAGTPCAALAEDSRPHETKETPTRIDVNEADGTVKIITKGREVACIDAAGLHVEGDIGSTGAVTAHDDEGVQPAAKPPKTERQ